MKRTWGGATRETQAKMYSVSSYFLAKTIVIIPFEVGSPRFFSTPLLANSLSLSPLPLTFLKNMLQCMP